MDTEKTHDVVDVKELAAWFEEQGDRVFASPELARALALTGRGLAEGLRIGTISLEVALSVKRFAGRGEPSAQ